MTEPDRSPRVAQGRDGATLRLLWPQWQGAGTSSVRELASEFPFDLARRGYAVGCAVLDAVLPPHDGPTATVPVSLGDEGLDERLVGFTIAESSHGRSCIWQRLVEGLPLIAPA